MCRTVLRLKEIPLSGDNSHIDPYCILQSILRSPTLNHDHAAAALITLFRRWGTRKGPISLDTI